LSKPSKQDTLLAALQRKTSVPSPEPLLTTGNGSAPASEPAAPVKAGRIGKPVQFWLHEEDRKLIRELSAWLAGQGIRPSDSMVVRAALRMASPGAAWLDCYRSAALLDGRLKR
jgi:hypothetical protein